MVDLIAFCYRAATRKERYSPYINVPLPPRKVRLSVSDISYAVRLRLGGLTLTALPASQYSLLRYWILITKVQYYYR